MTQPLALLLYEKLLPGTQLVNRLQDLKYRVRTLTDADVLVSSARQEKPMVVLVDLVSSRLDVSQALARLKEERDTQHIPVLAFAPDDAVESRMAAQKAGATVVVSDTAILSHLPQLLEQALQVD
jgi:DNA-binding response OmpR family regulator